MRNARTGDLFFGICSHPDHDPTLETIGIIVTGSENVMTRDRQQARIGDIGIGFCGHSTIIVSCSHSGFANDRGMARVGDAVSSHIDGVIISGADNVFTRT